MDDNGYDISQHQAHSNPRLATMGGLRRLLAEAISGASAL